MNLAATKGDIRGLTSLLEAGEDVNKKGGPVRGTHFTLIATSHYI
jgi:hypothetical protein